MLVTSSCMCLVTLSNSYQHFCFFEASSIECFRNVSQWNVLFNNSEAFTHLSLEASACSSSCCASSWAAASSFLLRHRSTRRSRHNLHSPLLSALSSSSLEWSFLEQPWSSPSTDRRFCSSISLNWYSPRCWRIDKWKWFGRKVCSWHTRSHSGHQQNSSGTTKKQ